MTEFDKVESPENDKVIVQVPVRKEAVQIPLIVLPRGTKLWEVNLSTGEVIECPVISRDLLPTEIKGNIVTQLKDQVIPHKEYHTRYQFREGGYDYQIAVNKDNALRKTINMIRRKGYRPAWIVAKA